MTFRLYTFFCFILVFNLVNADSVETLVSNWDLDANGRAEFSMDSRVKDETFTINFPQLFEYAPLGKGPYSARNKSWPIYPETMKLIVRSVVNDDNTIDWTITIQRTGVRDISVDRRGGSFHNNIVFTSMSDYVATPLASYGDDINLSGTKSFTTTDQDDFVIKYLTIVRVSDDDATEYYVRPLLTISPNYNLSLPDPEEPEPEPQPIPEEPQPVDEPDLTDPAQKYLAYLISIPPTNEVRFITTGRYTNNQNNHVYNRPGYDNDLFLSRGARATGNLGEYPNYIVFVANEYKNTNGFILPAGKEAWITYWSSTENQVDFGGFREFVQTSVKTGDYQEQDPFMYLAPSNNNWLIGTRPGNSGEIHDWKLHTFAEIIEWHTGEKHPGAVHGNTDGTFTDLARYGIDDQFNVRIGEPEEEEEEEQELPEDANGLLRQIIANQELQLLNDDQNNDVNLDMRDLISAINDKTELTNNTGGNSPGGTGNSSLINDLDSLYDSASNTSNKPINAINSSSDINVLSDALGTGQIIEALKPSSDTGGEFVFVMPHTSINTKLGTAEDFTFSLDFTPDESHQFSQQIQLARLFIRSIMTILLFFAFVNAIRDLLFKIT